MRGIAVFFVTLIVVVLQLVGCGDDVSYPLDAGAGDICLCISDDGDIDYECVRGHLEPGLCVSVRCEESRFHLCYPAFQKQDGE